MNYYSKWITHKLEKLKSKGIKFSGKKFNQYKKHYWVQISTLKLAEYIGRIIEFNNVWIEPVLSEGDADIKFVDDGSYYLQIKTPNFFIGNYGEIFLRLTKRFCNEVLSKSEPRFAYSHISRKGYSKPFIKEIKESNISSSLGYLTYDRFFPPQYQVIQKLDGYLKESYSQLKKISRAGKKIILIDITFYPMGNEYIYNALKFLYIKNFKTTKKIDGVALFSWNPLNINDDYIDSTIIPVELNRDVKSEVFKKPFNLYPGKMMTLPLCGKLKNEERKQFGINFKDQFFHVDGIEYINFKELIRSQRH